MIYDLSYKGENLNLYLYMFIKKNISKKYMYKTNNKSICPIGNALGVRGHETNESKISLYILLYVSMPLG